MGKQTPQVAYKGKPIRKTVDESVENLKTKRVESFKSQMIMTDNLDQSIQQNYLL